MQKEIVLAADLGGTNLRMAAIDNDGTILCRVKRETPRAEPGDEIVRAIVESAGDCRKSCPEFRIKAISLAVPGTVNVNSGVIITAPNLPALNNFGIVAALEERMDTRALLENDANAAAVGERWRGAARNFSDVILVTLGTGVGGGIITGGNVLRGGGRAGEIGHICVEPFGAPCRCGSRGCVEQYASASAIVRLAHELKLNFPDSFAQINSVLTAHDLFQSGEDGNELALEVFRLMGFYLGVALSSLINVMDPGVIVIGGGASAGWKLFMPQLRETVNQRAFGGLTKRVKILRGELGDDAGLLGAARLAFDELK